MIQEKVSKLHNFISEVTIEDDVQTLQALFRVYTFIASAYLLEPAHQHYVKTKDTTKEYGKALQELPENISQPLCNVADKLNVYPFLDYHYSYSLCNYVRKDKNGTLNWKNLDMACKFSGTPDEIGFIMVHVDINEHSKKLIESIKMSFDGIENKKVSLFLSGLELNHQTMTIINERRREMWSASNHKNYNDFRAFIMGIKGNDEIFGDGVKYLGTDNEEPRQYRGQSGSQDNIIPTQDIFTGVMEYYPKNQLTEYLIDMRTYRPKVIQNFFNDLIKDTPSMRDYIGTLEDSDKKIALIHFLLSVYEIFLFRNGHWQFVQKYIMSNTKYAKATGGTPITTWIPNQIEACLKCMDDLFKGINLINVKLGIEKDDTQMMNECMGESYSKYIKVKDSFSKHVSIFQSQIDELKKVDFDAGLVYLKNGEFEDSKL
jgi:indoleamine 2,3-dioxygenase